MAGVTGSFDALKDLRRRIGALRSQSFQKRIARNLAQEARRQALESFENERDPYGVRWKPSNSARFSHKTLQNRSQLRNSISTRTAEAGRFVIGTNVKYAAIHQYGGVITPKNKKALVFKIPVSVRIASSQRSSKGRKTNYRRKKGRSRADVNWQWVTVSKVTIPQRQFIPEGKLGDIWTEAFNEVVSGLIRKHFSE